jgi:hypothetical protein
MIPPLRAITPWLELSDTTLPRTTTPLLSDDMETPWL